nr:PREDICTED: centrosome and spindle pole-associated protein 1 [Latimeria chalumnae]|eukprot:XP_014351313.1 PREDICTED: centrosome and spindle pole-associated protein 1 [Latimeria chalumnae]
MIHKTGTTEILSEINRASSPIAKENIPPNTQRDAQQTSQPREENFGLSLPLGEEYERKKHKLKEELRLDYRRYMAQEAIQAKRKKNFKASGDIDPSLQGLSLPIGERRSAKERLRNERNKEYNQFLREQEENERIRQDRRRANQYYKDQDEEPPHFIQFQPELHTQAKSTQQETTNEAIPFKKDAYTSMQDYEELLNRRRHGEDRYCRLEEDPEIVYRRTHRIDSEPEHNRRYWKTGDGHDIEQRYYRHEEDPEFDNRRNPKLTDESMLPERRSQRENYENQRVMPRPKEKRVEDYDNYREPGSYSQRQRNEYRWPPIRGSHKASERSKSAFPKDKGDFATSLPLGNADRDVAQQRRKERYRQQLMEQMEEQRRNKRREKELELKVAASGAIDPEKEPDRLKQFGAVNRQHEFHDRDVPYRSGMGLGLDSGHTGRERPEERMPPERPRVAFQTPVFDDTGLSNAIGSGRYISAINEDFHRGLSNTLGEIVAPRLTSVPPPAPPTLTENYRTPYDDAYYFYGARNPLDPNLAYYGPGVMGAQPMAVGSVPLEQIPLSHHGKHVLTTGQSNTGARVAGLGIFPEEKPGQSKEAAQSYQETLKQQIREREERRRREKEEMERYEAKLEAEMREYNPWGKGGGGAPLRDAQGNLITDLKRMHKQNEDAYKNPDVKALQDKRAVVSLDLNLATPRLENGATSANKISGFTFAHTSPFARGNVFVDPPSEQQLQEQEKYKDFLRLQIEEKRRREEEEREKRRIEEEKEEQRLAEQRAKIMKEYEEEQERRRKKEEEQKLKNEELIRQAEERRKVAEKKRKEEEEKQDEELRQQYERERLARLEEESRHSRQPSPPVPALQKKVSSHQARRPLSTDSRVSTALSDRSQSGTQSPPVPARRNELRAHEDKKNVISELSELRKQLRSEQRRLQSQLLSVEREDENSPIMMTRKRERTPVDVFDMARLRMQAPVRRPSSKGPDPINIQNIREFNELKYRDTETREEVRQVYPDPPNNDQTLEIQQQALLREQQKKLNMMKKRRGVALEDYIPGINPQNMGLFKDPSEEFMKSSLLESESAFIGTNGETFPVLADSEPTPHPQQSARERRRQKKKSPEFDLDDAVPGKQPDSFSLHSISSLNVNQVRAKNEQRIKRLNNLQKDADAAGGNISTEDEDDLLKQFISKDKERPHSVDTVATDPWLRPGTSDTLKRFMAGESRRERQPYPDASTFNWQGLSATQG